MEFQELDIIAGKNFLVTSHYKIIRPLNSIFEECLKSEKAKMNYLKRGIGYLLFTIFRIYRAVEDTIKNSKETIESLEETSHILVTFNLNEIMKILTMFSALLLPPTLIASIWGMNTVVLPLAQSPIGFWLIILLIVIIVSVIAICFKIKKWF